MSIVSLQGGTGSTVAARLNRQSDSISRSVGQLSSGNRIVRAGDDVANMSVATKMLSRTTALRSSLTNLNQASSLLQVADDGLRQIEDLLQRMNEITTMANSGAVSKQDRTYLNLEITQLRDEIDRIAETTQFNGRHLLNIESDANQAPLTIEREHEVDFSSAGAASSGPPVTAGYVAGMDASSIGNITGHPGNVVAINDGSGSGNNIVADTGNVTSGSATIGGQNALSFDGNSFLRINDTADINLVAQTSRNVFVTFATGADVNSRQVVYEQGGTVNGFNIYIDGGQLYIGGWKSNGSAFNIHLSTAIQANSVYSAGFTFDGLGNGFTGYLNGEVIGNTAVGQNQNAHSGDIGIGGMNNDTRFFDGGANGDGFGFTGSIGEILNYQSILSPAEAADINNYVNVKWGITSSAGLNAPEGGDKLIAKNGAFNGALSEGGTVTGVEYVDLTEADESHQLNVAQSYFTAGSGVTENELTIDATGNREAIRVSASEIQGQNQVRILGSLGNDTISGSKNQNVIMSYANAAGVRVDLEAGTAQGYGEDDLTNIKYVEGSDGIDYLSGSIGRDTLIGGAGDDIITDAATSSSAGRLITNGLVSHIDTTELASISTTPGVVTVMTDQSGSGNDAQNAVGNVQSGISTFNDQNTLVFDGTGFLRIADTADINTAGQDQRAVFMTFETGDKIEARQVLYEEGGGTNGFAIYIENGQVYMTGWQGTGNTFSHIISAEIEKNTTYAVGFVFDATGSQTFNAYVNGKEIGSLAATTPQVAHTGAIGIGAMNDGSFFNGAAETGDNYNFVGKIGELLIYNNSTFTNEELTDLQNFLISRRVNGGDDLFMGGAGNDIITAGGGNDTIDGGDDIDTAVFSGDMLSYEIRQKDDGDLLIIDRRPGGDGVNIVRNIERLRFADGTINLFSFGRDLVSFMTQDNKINFLSVALPDARSENLFKGKEISVNSAEDAARAQNIVRDALLAITAIRARIGSTQARVNYETDAVFNSLQNQDNALSVVEDTDIASASTEYAKNLAKYQASTQILAQVNQMKRETVGDIMKNIEVETL